MAQASRGCCITQECAYTLISPAKTSVSLCVLVPLWCLVFNREGTETLRGTIAMVDRGEGVNSEMMCKNFATYPGLLKKSIQLNR